MGSEIKKRTVIVGKVNVTPNLFLVGQRPSQILLGVFAHPKQIVEKRRAGWAFVDVLVEGPYIAGRLARLKPREELVVEDFRTRAEHIPGAVQFYSNFVLDSDTETIAFEERSTIPPKQFSSLFGQLCRKIEPNLAWLEVEPRVTRIELDRQLARFKIIRRARFQLVPSNPTDAPEFQRLDQGLKLSRAIKAKLTASGATRAGLDLTVGLVKEALAMVAAGHGDCVLHGLDAENRPHKVYSRDLAVREDVEVSDAQVSDFLGKFKAIVQTHSSVAE